MIAKDDILKAFRDTANSCCTQMGVKKANEIGAAGMWIASIEQSVHAISQMPKHKRLVALEDLKHIQSYKEEAIAAMEKVLSFRTLYDKQRNEGRKKFPLSPLLESWATPFEGVRVYVEPEHIGPPKFVPGVGVIVHSTEDIEKFVEEWNKSLKESVTRKEPPAGATPLGDQPKTGEANLSGDSLPHDESPRSQDPGRDSTS